MDERRPTKRDLIRQALPGRIAEQRQLEEFYAREFRQAVAANAHEGELGVLGRVFRKTPQKYP